MLERSLVRIIRWYQRTLSPDHGWPASFYPGGYCKFVPTCSEYCADSIEKHGALKGIAKGAWRIIRCNPWSKGGIDPA